jgi:hypothetical protein
VTGREISPADHPDKGMRELLKELTKSGWELRKEGHWGRLYCDCGCSVLQVAGTPRNVVREVRRIRRQTRRCPLPEDDPRRGPRDARG